MRARTNEWTRFAVVLVAMTCVNGHAHQMTDEATIKELGVQWQNAWNMKDAKTMTNLLAPDVDFVTVLGPNGWLKGRAQFEEAHARMFTTLFTHSTWKTESTHVKWIQPDLAIARVLWSTTGDKVRHVKHGTPRSGIFTWVVQKQDGAWRIIASQNTESMPVLSGQ